MKNPKAECLQPLLHFLMVLPLRVQAGLDARPCLDARPDLDVGPDLDAGPGRVVHQEQARHHPSSERSQQHVEIEALREPHQQHAQQPHQQHAQQHADPYTELSAGVQSAPDQIDRAR